MILSPRKINFSAPKRIGLYGIPGSAKSTTALSAPGVLFVDADNGWRRIPASAKTAARIVPMTYGELLADLTADNVKGFDTIAIDTGGALLNLMKPWAIKANPKNGQNDGVTLSMKGYGAVGQEFERLAGHICNTLGKNLIVVFHAKEELDGDKKVYRLDVEGQTKNNIWKSMDLFGFMEVDSGKIMVGFSPTERYQAKATQGIAGRYELPNIMAGAKNDFLTKIFSMLDENAAAEAKIGLAYDALMEQVREIVAGVDSADKANKALADINAASHVFASLRESKSLLAAKTASLGLTYNKAKESFEVKA